MLAVPIARDQLQNPVWWAWHFQKGLVLYANLKTTVLLAALDSNVMQMLTRDRQTSEARRAAAAAPGGRTDRVQSLCQDAICKGARLSSQQLAQLSIVVTAFFAAQEWMRDVNNLSRLTAFQVHVQGCQAAQSSSCCKSEIAKHVDYLFPAAFNRPTCASGMSLRLYTRRRRYFDSTLTAVILHVHLWLAVKVHTLVANGVQEWVDEQVRAYGVLMRLLNRVNTLVGQASKSAVQLAAAEGTHAATAAGSVPAFGVAPSFGSTLAPTLPASQQHTITAIVTANLQLAAAADATSAPASTPASALGPLSRAAAGRPQVGTAPA